MLHPPNLPQRKGGERSQREKAPYPPGRTRGKKDNGENAKPPPAKKKLFSKDWGKKRRQGTIGKI